VASQAEISSLNLATRAFVSLICSSNTGRVCPGAGLPGFAASGQKALMQGCRGRQGVC